MSYKPKDLARPIYELAKFLNMVPHAGESHISLVRLALLKGMRVRYKLAHMPPVRVEPDEFYEEK